MLGDLLRSFGQIFGSTGSRAYAAAVIGVMAAVPVADMVVLRFFTHLVLESAERLRTDPAGLAADVAIFFVAWAATRAVHHGVRLARVRLLNRRLAAPGRKLHPSRQSWDWALALEVSTLLVSVVQIIAFSLLFLVLDVPVGVANAVVCAVVVTAISLLYREQLGRQRDYLRPDAPRGALAIGQRVGGRIRAAEFGAVAGTAGMAIVLGVVLFRTAWGGIAGADAIVFALALRVLYGQMSQVSGGGMRFARARARQEG